MKSEPVAVTTQEALYGSREKAMRIASVEKVELGNIMELSVVGQILKWERQMNLSGGLSLCSAVGWNTKKPWSSDGRPTLACEDSPQHAGCDDQGR